jgi:hypothetical protein
MEFYKFIGATIGIITGIFAIFDWLVRGRPSVYLKTSEEKRTILIIKNTSKHSILIADIKAKGTDIFFVGDDNKKSIMDWYYSQNFNIYIDPDNHLKFYIYSNSDIGEIAPFKKKNFKIKIHWRRGDNTFFWRFPLIVKGYSTDIIAP